MYLDNKYTSWYYNIINKAQKQIKTGYVEIHHIIPRSMGGNNSSDNLVNLTAKEHFICHLLLTKMVEGQNKFKMIKAARMMSYITGPKQQRYKVNSRIYENLMKHIEVPHEIRKKISIAQKERFKTC